MAERSGISVYVHTVNEVEAVAELKEIGVKGGYTDYISPAMLEGESVGTASEMRRLFRLEKSGQKEYPLQVRRTPCSKCYLCSIRSF